MVVRRVKVSWLWHQSKSSAYSVRPRVPAMPAFPRLRSNVMLHLRASCSCLDSIEVGWGVMVGGGLLCNCKHVIKVICLSAAVDSEVAAWDPHSCECKPDLWTQLLCAGSCSWTFGDFNFSRLCWRDSCLEAIEQHSKEGTQLYLPCCSERLQMRE